MILLEMSRGEEMSEKQLKFEECLLEEATHIEMGGKVHKFIQSGNLHKVNSFAFLEAIHKDLLPKLGIKPLKEKEEETK
ncbi:hypothetical protein UFOVP423_47 [uncultured Caudovirales phage]|uniref:Uncharacterized protein n=1 Tax=uncultured Caudovirales phage TaxID=2100421 RepID=A0A6J5M5P5_9CAUD|nr:hypothetical protein UFOVP423_47 [uncultured Caudovirales phage]